MKTIMIPLSKIISNPRQPRSIFDVAEMASLTASVRQYGILQPLLVTELSDGGYCLIAGERRLRAAREVELLEAPAVIVPQASDRDMLEMALIENVQRADLNPLEKARAYQELIDRFDLSHEDVAERVGQHRSTITNSLRLLKLPDNLQASLLSGSISERQATALLALYDLPQSLRNRAEQHIYDPSLRPSNVQEKVLSGASSDYVRETINRMLLAFGKNIIWPVDTAFAMPPEAHALCAECPSLIKRGGDNLCGNEDCFYVRLNAYNKQSLPLPEPAPTAPAPKVKVEIKSFTSAAPAAEPEDEEPETAQEPVVFEYPASTQGPAQPEESAPEEVEQSAPPADAPAPAVQPAPPATPFKTWEESTILITLQYGPQDGHPDGRAVNVGLRANNNIPGFRIVREKDTLLPGFISGLLLDMETKLKEG